MSFRPFILSLLIATGVFAACNKDKQPLQLIRRPYIQTVWADSATVVWKTNNATQNAEVHYGLTTLSEVAQGTSVKERDGSYTHSATLKNLQRGKHYNYAVFNNGKNMDADNAALDYFTSQPDSAQPFTFLAFGDIGRNPLEDGFPQVTAARINKLTTHPAFMVGLGDIVYPVGDSKVYDDYLFKPFANVFSNVPFYPGLGNHDWGSDPENNFVREWKLPNNEHYYSYNHLNVHFITLDSKDGDFYKFEEQKNWLINDLQQAQGQYDFIIVALHHNGKSCTYKNNYEKVMELYPIFAQYNVDLVLNGHAHTYERLHPYDGNGNVLEQYRADIHHYPDIQNGFISITSGSGGILQDGWGPGNCPGQITAMAHHAAGFMQFTVNGTTLKAQFINSNTGAVVDEFEVVK